MSRTARAITSRPPRQPAGRVVDGFLPGRLAMAMRRDIDAHFTIPKPTGAAISLELLVCAEPCLSADRCRRGSGASITLSPLCANGRRAIWAWLRRAGPTSAPRPGCRQVGTTLRNGPFRLRLFIDTQRRCTTGGETLVLREGDPFRDNLTSAAAGRGLYEAIEPRFNRLVIFDDRLPHAVERIDGMMDPVEGRFVLHGHLNEGSAIIVGALPAAVATDQMNAALARFGEEMAATAALYRGPLVFRLTINGAGAVESCEIIVDRVIHPDYGHVGWDEVRAALRGRLNALKFPAAKGRTVLIQPVLFGGSAAAG